MDSQGETCQKKYYNLYYSKTIARRAGSGTGNSIETVMGTKRANKNNIIDPFYFVQEEGKSESGF